MPCSMISTMDPLALAMTGVPQAMASTTLYPNGSSKLIRWSRAWAGTEDLGSLGGRGDRTEIPHVLTIEVRFDLVVEVLLVLDDSCDVETSAGSSCDLDRLCRALVGVDAPEVQEVISGCRVHAERERVDPVMDGGRIVQVRVPVGVADRDVVGRRVVALVDRDDAG